MGLFGANMPISQNPHNLKGFLDEKSDLIFKMKEKESSKLFNDLLQMILTSTAGSEEEIEDILDFFTSNVIEMMKSSRNLLEILFENQGKFKYLSKFHVLISAVVSTIVGEDEEDFGSLDCVVDALILGLTAIESDTISLSGSSLIKLLKWDKNGRISRILRNHPDFIAILTADMCAMFSRIDESGSMAFLRIVRFCELLIDVSDKESKLSESIVESISKEFIEKVFRNTLRMIGNLQDPLKWCSELLKGCQRGNEITRPIISEVFNCLKSGNNYSIQDNSDILDILRNERSRSIEGIVQFLFCFTCAELQVLEVKSLKSEPIKIDNDADCNYKSILKRNLESFNRFRVPSPFKYNSLTSKAVEIMKKDRQVLLNWLPYVCKMIRVRIENDAEDEELLINLDISRKLIEFLDL